MKFTLTLALFTLTTFAADGNRLAYLDDTDPYYVGPNFPKLITPQWVGEEGVEAVIILSIDDLKDPVRYETFLRPILNRLKEIDGRAAFSIFCNKTDPQHPNFRKWLDEGVSLENHTLTHPFPLLNSNSLAKSKRDYDGGLDQLYEIPGAKPAAFRTPNCDGRNTLSPRVFTELLNSVTDKGHFLTIDSSVFNFQTGIAGRGGFQPPSIGAVDFRKYIPNDVFVNSIFDYPYPYVIGNLCWEFPCMAPSDYEASTKNGNQSPQTVADMKAGIDAAVAAKGVFTLCFHPHGWIRNTQIIELIDHAVTKHGKKVKFLTFREAQDRIDKNLLAGNPLRDEKGGDNGVRLMDIDNDDYLDVVIGNDKIKLSRVWQPQKNSWKDIEFPLPLIKSDGKGTVVHSGGRFGILRPDKRASMLIRNDDGTVGSWSFNGEKWDWGMEISGLPANFFTLRNGQDAGARLRDIDGDGICELIVGNDDHNQAMFRQAVHRWSEKENTWKLLPFKLPPDTSIINADRRDAGLRFVDLNGDGFDDIIFSNESRFSVHLFESMEKGWSKQVTSGVRGSGGIEIPMIARNGANNGVWFHSKYMNIQNENITYDRVSFADLAAGVQNAKTPHPPAQTPGDSKAALKLYPGFVAELMAAEPFVEDPIAFDWGPDGKLWVVEMGDYPLGIDGKGKPGGKIKILESTHGDGKYDKMTVFLEGLNFPTGVTVWKKGVLIIAAPDLFYAEDTDGDGKCDKREVLFTGFKEGNQQHRANGLVRGLDNWLYGANGDSGGKITSTKTGAVVDIGTRDFRLKPDEGILETVSGRSQFGRTRDDFGEWFGCMNSAPLYHYPIEERYLRRNPHAAAPNTAVKFGDHGLFPISSGVPGFNFTRRFTSACSPVLYRDDLFGKEFENSIFVSEPAHNLIHREILAPQGSTFTSERAPDEPDFDFIASADPWCRPATVKVGPDGALWFADMYRYAIEHPQWIPQSVQGRIDVRAGADKGRIYRVYPKNTKPRQIPTLGILDATMLDSPSGWQRDLAQELIIQQQRKDFIPQLEVMALSNQRPQTRLQALCTLEGLGALKPAELILELGNEKHPGVLANVLRLSEPLLKTNAVLAEAVLKLPDSSNDRVMLQLACTLGEIDTPRAAARLSKLATQHSADPYLITAIFSSLNKNNFQYAISAALLAKNAQLIGKLASLAPQIGDANTFPALVRELAVPDKLDSFAILLDGTNGSLDKLLPKNAGERLAVLELYKHVRLMTKPRTAPDKRLRAIKLLGRGLDQRDDDLALLAKLLSPQFDAETQSAALAQLVALGDTKVGELVLAGWRGYGAALRSQVVLAMFRREPWLDAELTLLEKGKILPNEIDASPRQRLLWSQNASIKARAEKIFAGAVNPDRQKVIDAFKPALTLAGVADSGAKTFADKCAACHRLGQTGTPVGPNLDALADNSAEALAIAILDPNRAIEPRYISYQVATNDGLRFQGMLESESPNSIVILEQGAKRTTIARADIKALASTGISTMPEGLETGLAPQDLANLIAYVRSFKPQAPRRIFAGNVPETIKPAADGSLTFPAAAAEIFGTKLAFETEHSNLGWWTEPADYAQWTAAVPAAQKYEVFLDYACPNEGAGNEWQLICGAATLSGKVEPTGAWENYRQKRVGELTLSDGEQKLIFKPNGKINKHLLDLRSIKLKPSEPRP